MGKCGVMLINDPNLQKDCLFDTFDVPCSPDLINQIDNNEKQGKTSNQTNPIDGWILY
jgi:hypothetical protein